MQIGTQVGPYEILEALGRGGMGEVYRARDTRLNRHVAVKTMAPGALSDQHARDRFDREARAVAALSHPNVLAIYDVGNHDGLPYIATELLEGNTLRTRLGSPLPISTVVSYALQIGRGLAAAHDRGIVHRDLKPDNIFITADGQVKLLDFGLATDPSPPSEDDATRLGTTPGLVLGTAGYMAPEQAKGLRADARSDIFAFGCVLYEMLTGRRAFTGATPIETIHAVLGEHPPDVTSQRADVPKALDRVVRRCLEKSPAARFQSARDLVFAIETFSDGTGPTAPAVTPVPVPAPRRFRRAAVLAALLAAAGAAGAWWTLSDRILPQPTATAAADDGPRLLAVLPFENISPDGEGSFASGMTEEITNQLSKLHGLRVVARTAVLRFQDPRRQMAEMAKELGIGSVVAGTVREDGTRVRVNVELIDARSGQLIWSEQYDRDGVDVFTAQSDIALRVGEALNASITLEERARVGKRPTSSVAAYDLYIRARNLRAENPEETLTRRLELLQKAVALDPQFADAYAEMSNLNYFLATYYGNRTALAGGIEAAQKAIAIDPDHALGYRGLGLNLSQLGRMREALAAYHKAAELGPSIAGVFADLSYGSTMAGRYDEALKAALQASHLNGGGEPNGSGGYHPGVTLVLLNDDARAAQYLTRKLERFPDAMRLHILLAMYDLRRGERQAAVDRIRAAAVKHPNNIEVLLTRAEILTFAGTDDAAQAVRELMPRAADGLLHSAPYPVKLLHAYHLRRAGATAEAREIEDAIAAANRQSLVGGADAPLIFMQNAAILALRGETAQALDEIERGYEAGWRDGRMLAIDALLASLRKEPRFQQVLAKIDADVAAMRARADYSNLR